MPNEVAQQVKPGPQKVVSRSMLEEEGRRVRDFVKGQQREKGQIAAPYQLAIFDKKTGTLTPGFEEFARALAYARPLDEAWEESFTNEPFNKAIAKPLSFHPLIATRVTQIHAEKLKFEEAVHRSAIEASGITREWILVRLAETVLLGHGDSIVRRDPQSGETRIIYGKQDLQASKAALELLGHEQGMFIPHRQARETPLGTLSDEDIEAQLQDLRSQQLTINVTVNGNGSAVGIGASAAEAFRGNHEIIDQPPEPPEPPSLRAPEPELRARPVEQPPAEPSPAAQRQSAPGPDRRPVPSPQLERARTGAPAGEGSPRDEARARRLATGLRQSVMVNR